MATATGLWQGLLEVPAAGQLVPEFASLVMINMVISNNKLSYP